MNKLIVNGDELTGRRLEGYLMQHPERLEELESQTDELVMLALDQDVSSLRFVRVQTEEICKYAITLDPYAIKYIRKLTPEMARYGCELYPELIKQLPRDIRKKLAA